MHIAMFSGMYTSLGRGDILVGMCGSWEKIVVDQRSSERIFKQVKHSFALTELSHDLYACLDVLMHIDMFSGMKTSLGSGDILVRMCGSREKIMADQLSSGCIFKQMKPTFALTEVSHNLHACLDVVTHIEMFSGM